MRTEHKILAVSTFFSIVAATLIYNRFVMPTAAPKDLQMIQLEERVPPFFDNIFRSKDATSTEFLINDPVTGVRGRPLLPEIEGVGPHDLLGFRNCAVPNQADLVVIGDSQTYGNNASQKESWPAKLEQLLQAKNLTVYQMATGSWAIPQYLHMLPHALNFRPQIVVISIYTGNDLYETFRMVYSYSTWSRLRLDPGVTVDTLPKITFPPAIDQQWSAVFKNRDSITFTPSHRLASNDHSNRAIQVAQSILEKAIGEFDELAEKFSLPILVALIPTKETVFAERVKAEIRDIPTQFSQLVSEEAKTIESVKVMLQNRRRLRLIDTTDALRRSLRKGLIPYPVDSNGHPNAIGYSAIADVIFSEIDPLLLKKDKRLIACG